MKISRIASMLGLAAGLLSASSAMATNQCVNCNYVLGAPSYLGALNPLTSDTANFRRPDLGLGQLVALTGVTDTWVFDIAPAGTFSLTASFNPFFGGTNRISNFTVSLFSATGSVCLPVTNGFPNDFAGACSSISTGAMLAAGVPSFSGVAQSGAVVFPVALLNPGRYAFRFVYDLALPAGQTSDYSGQISMTRTVPEPGTLALAGLALMGVAAGLRRARKA